jgi:transcriptional regulator with XRE-family HTH domain
MANRKKNAFGDRIRELRKAKGYSLRKLAPLVGVGFSYLSKVENGRLDFDGSPSESLIHRLADVLEADEDELLLLARHLPKEMADRIFEQPEVFRLLSQCDNRQLLDLARSCGISEKATVRSRKRR